MLREIYLKHSEIHFTTQRIKQIFRSIYIPFEPITFSTYAPPLEIATLFGDDPRTRLETIAISNTRQRV